MATTVEECQQICELVRETGLKYMMAETVVYSREYLFIKEMADNGGGFYIDYGKSAKWDLNRMLTGNGSSTVGN